MASVIIVPDAKGKVTAIQLANASWQAGDGGCMDIVPNCPKGNQIVVRADDAVPEDLEEVLAAITTERSRNPFFIWASALSKNHDAIYSYNSAMIEYVRAYVDESRKRQAAFDAIEEPLQEVWFQGKRMVTLCEHHSPRIINAVADPELAAVLTCYDTPIPCVVVVATKKHQHLFLARRQTFETAQKAYVTLFSQVCERDTWKNWAWSLIFGHRTGTVPYTV